MKTMEEAVRFYNHFGLSMADDPRELPDHLTTEVEFLHFRAFRAAEALTAGGDAGPYLRAERDFGLRQPPTCNRRCGAGATRSRRGCARPARPRPGASFALSSFRRRRVSTTTCWLRKRSSASSDRSFSIAA